MPTRNGAATPEQDTSIADMVEAGEHRNAREAIRQAIRQGVKALARGEYTELAEEELVVEPNVVEIARGRCLDRTDLELGYQ